MSRGLVVNGLNSLSLNRMLGSPHLKSPEPGEFDEYLLNTQGLVSNPYQMSLKGRSGLARCSDFGSKVWIFCINA